MDIDRLQELCTLEESEFASMGDVLISENLLVHIKRGGKIMGVAHLDTMSSQRHFFVSRNEAGEVLQVWSPSLDNRLGVYILLDLLPTLGVECDVLLTTNSTYELSTASEFYCEQEYDWVFSFDRAGTDVCMYQYESQRNTKLLSASGLRTGGGGYTDIVDMWFLGITGFNFGNGIVRGNTVFSSVLPRVAAHMVEAFARFYKANKGTELPYEPSGTDLEAYRYRHSLYNQVHGHAPEPEGSPPWEPAAVWGYCDICGGSFTTDELSKVDGIDSGAVLCIHCKNLYSQFA